MIIPKVEVKRILYATDLSDNARHAFSYAVSLANLYGAGITLLHVLEEMPKSLDRSILGYISSKRWEEIKNQHYEEAKQTLTGKRRDHVPIREALGQFCQDVKSNSEDCDFETDEILITQGHPAQEIIEQAQKQNCDLIVMGTHGHGFFEDALMGSVAQRVVRRSKIPVLVVSLPEE